MANRKANRKLTTSEVEERASERARARTLRWQRIAFILISVIVLASMIIALFVRY
jgi:hypothetical protein